MKTCIRCGWIGEEDDVIYEGDGVEACPRCDKTDYIQSHLELHLRLDGWEHFITINKPARLARAVSQNPSDFITGAPAAKKLARIISAAFDVEVKVVGEGLETVIDEF